MIDNTPHKIWFNPLFSAIFFETFYESHNDINYLLKTIFPCLQSLHLSKMWVYKFVELNPFGNIIDVLPDDLWYAKLIALYSAKCDEMFYNKVKSKSLNKKR